MLSSELLVPVNETTDRKRQKEERDKKRKYDRTQTKLSASHLKGIMYKY